MLLTRSPLSTRASPGFSFDLHVLGAPPAFVLSQDQTLHRDFNPTNTQVEHEIGEPPFRVTSAPVRQLARRPPRGSRRAELMVTCLTTRPHWLLASLFRFQGATTRHRHACGPQGRATVPRAPSRHSLCLHQSRLGAGSAGASVSIHLGEVPRADWSYYGLTPASASRRRRNLADSVWR